MSFWWHSFIVVQTYVAYAAHLVFLTHSPFTSDCWNSTPKKKNGTQKPHVERTKYRNLTGFYLLQSLLSEHWKWSNIFCLHKANRPPPRRFISNARIVWIIIYWIMIVCGAEAHTNDTKTRTITMATTTTTNWTIHRICHLTHFVARSFHSLGPYPLRR